MSEIYSCLSEIATFSHPHFSTNDAAVYKSQEQLPLSTVTVIIIREWSYLYSNIRARDWGCQSPV